MLTYRKTTAREDETFGIKCVVIKDNSMQCTRRPTRLSNFEYYCEGHFQVILQNAIADKEVIMNLDEPSEEKTGISEPAEKSK